MTSLKWLHVLKDRTQVINFVQSLYAKYTNQFNNKLKILRTNNALEYKHSHFQHFVKSKGIIPQTSCVDTS